MGTVKVDSELITNNAKITIAKLNSNLFLRNNVGNNPIIINISISPIMLYIDI